MGTDTEPTMTIQTNVKTLTKAAKKAGITFSSGKGSHVKWTAPNGRTFSFSGHAKETSKGVAEKAWAFINGDYDKAYR